MKTGTADLPFITVTCRRGWRPHGAAGRVVVEALVLEYGRDEVLRGWPTHSGFRRSVA